MRTNHLRQFAYHQGCTARASATIVQLPYPSTKHRYRDFSDSQNRLTGPFAGLHSPVTLPVTLTESHDTSGTSPVTSPENQTIIVTSYVTSQVTSCVTCPITSYVTSQITSYSQQLVASQVVQLRLQQVPVNVTSCKSPVTSVKSSHQLITSYVPVTLPVKSQFHHHRYVTSQVTSYISSSRYHVKSPTWLVTSYVK